MSPRQRAAILIVVAGLAFPAAAGAMPNDNSTATITASFADSCRDFAAVSSKDISHVELHYADGRVVKDEGIPGTSHEIDEDAGDEISFAAVKSGTTSETFTCPQTNSPPTAILEIKTPPLDDPATPGCFPTFSPPYLYCFYSTAGDPATSEPIPQTTWTSWEATVWWWFCGESTFTFAFRGTSSTDPDDDIANWSIDFGDGTSASGDWAADPPLEVVREYPFEHFVTHGLTTVTLTVTDSAGQTSSDALTTGVANACND